MRPDIAVPTPCLEEPQSSGEYNIPEATMSARTDTEASRAQASTGMTPATLSDKLKDKLGASHVDIVDLSGT
jgi:hypothetical protein